LSKSSGFGSFKFTEKKSFKYDTIISPGAFVFLKNLFF